MTRPCALISSTLDDDHESRFHSGEVIGGRYRLDHFIGRGSMGEVWQAEHLHLRSRVAIKFFIDPYFEDPERAQFALERFRFEAQVAARLGARTQHVVTVHDADIDPNGPFLVMERVDGCSLDANFESEGRLSLARVASLVGQIAEALEVAHAEGIVHRDLKPSNILITDKPGGGDMLKVGDFGVAKAMDGPLTLDKPRQTARGFVVGTPNYMSPEQVCGGKVDGCADRWALAVLAYEALTGRLPFSAPTHHQRMYAITTRPHERVCKLRPELPFAMDGWFQKALHKKREKRFATTREMVEALEGIVARSAPVEPSSSGDRNTVPSALPGSRAANPARSGDVMMSRPADRHDEDAPEISYRESNLDPEELDSLSVEQRARSGRWSTAAVVIAVLTAALAVGLLHATAIF